MKILFILIVISIIAFGLWLSLSPFFKEIGSVIKDKKISLQEDLDDEYNEKDGF